MYAYAGIILWGQMCVLLKSYYSMDNEPIEKPHKK
jgi:hypothetical protein